MSSMTAELEGRVNSPRCGSQSDDEPKDGLPRARYECEWVPGMDSGEVGRTYVFRISIRGSPWTSIRRRYYLERTT
jgi:hypothetical protein